jgi:competence protein ComEC
VIPAAVLALVLAPLGLDWIGLWAMGLGLDWILGVAHWVAAIDGARGYVIGPGGWVLPLLALGFLMLILWQGRLRWAGLAAMGLSFVLWHGASRPDVLIADTGGLVGVMTPDGRALSKAKGADFVARNFLENDGSGASQQAAAKLWQAGSLVHLSGKRAVAAFDSCTADQVVVATAVAAQLVGQGCLLFDPPRLKETGAVALRKAGTGWQITTARQTSGERLWTAWPKAQKR